MDRKDKDFIKNPTIYCLALIVGILFKSILVTFSILFLEVAILEIINKKYFDSGNFRAVKDKVSEYVTECNELSEHIEYLKNEYKDIGLKKDYGKASFKNTSKYNYRMEGAENLTYSKNVYECSRTVCSNAQKQPFKYLCKYFNIEINENTLESFEGMFENFTAAEKGTEYLDDKFDDLKARLLKEVPASIRLLWPEKLMNEIGLKYIEVNNNFYPKFIFSYTSTSGKASQRVEIKFDLNTTEKFIKYLSEEISRKKKASYQRSLMTPAYRKKILQRDDYTCRICGNSIYKEPNLLLEIDHIVPVSKGGKTEDSNLQTLCWKCNRSKSNKLMSRVDN